MILQPGHRLACYYDTPVCLGYEHRNAPARRLLLRCGAFSIVTAGVVFV